MNTKYCITLATMLLCWCSATTTAQQTVQVFTNKSEFLEATAATNCTGLLPRLPGFVPGGLLHLGAVTFSISSPSVRFQCNEFTPLLPGGELLITGTENLNADFDEAVTVAGFDFLDTTTGSGGSCPGRDSTFALTLRDGLTVVATFAFNAPDDIASFIGVQSSLPFRRLEIRETSGGCENDYCGSFFCRAVPPAPSASIRLRLSEVEVCWPSQSNLTYRVDYCSDLTTKMWAPLLTSIMGTGETLCVTDKIGHGQSQRYYRVVRLTE